MVLEQNCSIVGGARTQGQGGGLVLKVEAKSRRNGARRDVMGSAESRKEVIDRFGVHQVHYRETRTYFVPVSLKEVVVAD